MHEAEAPPFQSPPPPAERRHARLAGWAALGEVLLMLLVAMLATVLLTLPLLGSFDPAGPLTPATMRSSLSVQALVFFVAGLLLLRLRLFRAHPAAASSPWYAVCGLGVAGGVLSFLASVVISSALNAVGISVEEQPWLQEILSDRGAVLALSPWIVLLAPISEEIFFRGYAFRFLRQRIGFGTALWTSSALFALVHLNLPAFPVYLAIGAIFALVYARTSNLGAPLLAHITHNAIVLAASALTFGSSAS